jgi:molybdate transport system permease protein
VAHAPGAAAVGAGVLSSGAHWGPKGRWGDGCWRWAWPTLPFTFAGLVVASVFYSLPFVVQPLQQAFEAWGSGRWKPRPPCAPVPLDTFFSVVLPLAGRAWSPPRVLGFAHTVGEFGVVLMIGGNIPGVRRACCRWIYDHVEALEFADAHRLAAGMVVFALRCSSRCRSTTARRAREAHE